MKEGPWCGTFAVGKTDRVGINGWLSRSHASDRGHCSAALPPPHAALVGAVASAHHHSPQRRSVSFPFPPPSTSRADFSLSGNSFNATHATCALRPHIGLDCLSMVHLQTEDNFACLGCVSVAQDDTHLSSSFCRSLACVVPHCSCGGGREGI